MPGTRTNSRRLARDFFVLQAARMLSSSNTDANHESTAIQWPKCCCLTCGDGFKAPNGFSRLFNNPTGGPCPTQSGAGKFYAGRGSAFSRSRLSLSPRQPDRDTFTRQRQRQRQRLFEKRLQPARLPHEAACRESSVLFLVREHGNPRLDSAHQQPHFLGTAARPGQVQQVAHNVEQIVLGGMRGGRI